MRKPIYCLYLTYEQLLDYYLTIIYCTWRIIQPCATPRTSRIVQKLGRFAATIPAETIGLRHYDSPYTKARLLLFFSGIAIVEARPRRNSQGKEGSLFGSSSIVSFLNPSHANGQSQQPILHTPARHRMLSVSMDPSGTSLGQSLFYFLQLVSLLLSVVLFYYATP